MKKFTKIINESKKEVFRKHPLINPVDWDDIFKPLIDHIESNFDVPSPGDPVFSKRTMKRLSSFMSQVFDDYTRYWIDNIDDGSQETFIQTFNIDIEWDKFVDITRVIEDNCSDVNESSNYEEGTIDVTFTKFTYKSIEDLIEDIKDVCGKMKMFKNLNWSMGVYFPKPFYIKDDDLDKDYSRFYEFTTDKYKVENLDRISISVYNKETSGDNFIPRKYLE